MDPSLRMLLEVTHEAIVDAGVNPGEIRGSRTGVFIGSCSSESQSELFQRTETTHGYAMLGTSRSMLANRVSFAFDLRGPSIPIDTACSSSLIALQQAVTSIHAGHCDAAIVGGVNINLDPTNALQYHKLKCSQFTENVKVLMRAGAGIVGVKRSL